MRDKLSAIPRLPGCYIFRNRLGQIIYIGKSKSLYHRVRQYFNLVPSKDPREYNKYAELAKEVADIETIITDTETNALILECALIKTHKPKYNAQLKSPSDYHFICVDTTRTFPTITIVSAVKEDGRRYFGSFYDFYDAEKTVALINAIWKTPVCNKANGDAHAKPCLNFHIGKCCAPCGGMPPVEAYRAVIAEIIKCLSGSGKGALRRLVCERNAFAGALAFEKAAKVQEKIAGLENLMKKQKRLYTDLRGKDVFLFLRAFNEPRFSLFYIRDGVVTNRADFPGLDEPEAEAFKAFLRDESPLAELSPGDSPLAESLPGDALPKPAWENSVPGQLRPGNFSLEDGKYLTGCLLEIGADKLFLPVSRSANAARRLKILRNGFKTFLSV